MSVRVVGHPIVIDITAFGLTSATFRSFKHDVLGEAVSLASAKAHFVLPRPESLTELREVEGAF
jgi:hypothetical protein